MSRVEIKERAKKQLGGSIFTENWLIMVLIVFIADALSTAIAGIPAIGAIIAIIVAGPLAYGKSYVFLKQSKDGQKADIGELFKGFQDELSGNILLGFMQALFIFLWMLLLIIPGIVKAYSYSMSFYIKNDNPEYTWKQCIDTSKKMMNGHKAELFVLDLSFIGWAIVGALCLGVGTLWVMAYKEAAYSQFYLELKGNTETAEI